MSDNNCSEGMPRPARRNEKMRNLETAELVEKNYGCQRIEKRKTQNSCVPKKWRLVLQRSDTEE